GHDDEPDTGLGGNTESAAPGRPGRPASAERTPDALPPRPAFLHPPPPRSAADGPCGPLGRRPGGPPGGGAAAGRLPATPAQAVPPVGPQDGHPAVDCPPPETPGPGPALCSPRGGFGRSLLPAAGPSLACQGAFPESAAPGPGIWRKQFLPLCPSHCAP